MAAKNSTIGTFLELWEHFRGSIFCRFTASDHEITIFAFSFLFFLKKITKLFSKDRFNENLLRVLFVTAARKIFSKSFRKAPVTKFAQELFGRGYLNCFFFLRFLASLNDVTRQYHYVKLPLTNCPFSMATLMDILNPFVPNAPFLYPLKTSENLTAFCCFQCVEEGCIKNE